MLSKTFDRSHETTLRKLHQSKLSLVGSQLRLADISWLQLVGCRWFVATYVKWFHVKLAQIMFLTRYIKKVYHNHHPLSIEAYLFQATSYQLIIRVVDVSFFVHYVDTVSFDDNQKYVRLL